jgi:hypothetical protein
MHLGPATYPVGKIDALTVIGTCRPALFSKKSPEDLVAGRSASLAEWEMML